MPHIKYLMILSIKEMCSSFPGVSFTPTQIFKCDKGWRIGLHWWKVLMFGAAASNWHLHLPGWISKHSSLQIKTSVFVGLDCSISKSFTHMCLLD